MTLIVHTYVCKTSIDGLMVKKLVFFPFLSQSTALVNLHE